MIALAAVLAAAPASASETLWTSYLRVGPGPQYMVEQELPMHSPLGVLGCESGWCRVQSGAVLGYVRQQSIGEPTPPPVATAGAGADCFDTVLSGHPGGDHVRVCRR